MKKYTLEYVSKEFSKRGYTLLSTEYKDSLTPLRYLCGKHGERKIRFFSLLNGNVCARCAAERTASSRRLSIDDVRKMFLERGYELISTTYENNRTKLKYYCGNKEHGVREITYANFRNGCGCIKCRGERSTVLYSGENASMYGKKGPLCPNWKGGTTELSLYLRNLLTEWKKTSLSIWNYTCFISGERAKGVKFHVHHYDKPFHLIRDDILNELGIEMKESVGDYKEYELKDISDNFLIYHNANPGVPIRKDIHRLFHDLYGNDTNEADLLEFKARYDAGEFIEILAKKKRKKSQSSEIGNRSDAESTEKKSA